MEDIPITAEASPRDERLTAGLIAQYIHELSGRHAAVRRAARPDRAPVRESGGA